MACGWLHKHQEICLLTPGLVNSLYFAPQYPIGHVADFIWWSNDLFAASRSGELIINNNNKSIFKAQNLVPSDYSRDTHTRTRAHARARAHTHTHTRAHTQFAPQYPMWLVADFINTSAVLAASRSGDRLCGSGNGCRSDRRSGSPLPQLLHLRLGGHHPSGAVDDMVSGCLSSWLPRSWNTADTEVPFENTGQWVLR